MTFPEREAIIGPIMKSGAEFRGPSPRVNFLVSYLRAHKPNLKALEDHLYKSEVAQLVAAQQSGYAVEPPKAERRLGAKIKEGMKHGKAHHREEDHLLRIVDKILDLKQKIREVEAFLTNPYLRKNHKRDEKLRRRSGRYGDQLLELETEEVILRDKLATSNSKLPVNFRLNPHVPDAYKGSGEA